MKVAAWKLGSFSADVLRSCGADASEARAVAAVLVWSDLMGRRNYGVWRLPILARRVAQGLIHSPCRPRVTRQKAAVELLHGDRGFGHYVGEIAMKRAVDLARGAGVGVVGVYDSNFYGAGAYFVQLAAEHGMVSLALSNSFPKVAAHGGLERVLGTNPFAFGAPRRSGRSLLLDMATSAGAGSSIMQCIEEGGRLPEGIAIDAQGQPITDPALVERGALLPFGGAKGYGISLLVEILCGVLTGAGISREVRSMYGDFERSGDNGHFFLALDIEKFMPLDAYYDRMERLVCFLEASRGGADRPEVLLPGEHRWRALDRNRRDGIELDAHVGRVVEDLSQQYGVALPW